MEVEKVAASVFLHSYMELQKWPPQKSRFWIHPLLQDQSSKGIFHLLFNDYGLHEETFFSFTRMSIASFDELLLHLKEGFIGTDTKMRDSE